jgi:hypothetical protein
MAHSLFTAKFSAWDYPYPEQETERMREERANILETATDWMRPVEIGRKVGLSPMRTSRHCSDLVKAGSMEERPLEIYGAVRREFRRKT